MLLTIIPLSSITVLPDRTRQTFKKTSAEELAASLKTVGLIQPIAVNSTAEPTRYELIAGERRMRAVTLINAPYKFCGETIPALHVPVLINPELSEVDALEKEIHENIYREDLPWQERAAALAKLHALRVKENPQHTLQATAEEAVVPDKAVQNSLLLAPHLADPNISAAPSEAEALRRVRSNMEQVFVAELSARAAMLQKTPAGSPFRLEKGNCIELLATLPERADVCLTDPPYGISAHLHGHETETSHQYQDNPKWFREQAPAWAAAIAGALKDQAHVYWFLEFKWFGYVQNLFEELGFEVYPRPIIWTKNIMAAGNAALWPARSYEMILYAVRGKKSTQGQLRPDSINLPIVTNKTHAAEKPVDLYVELLRRSTVPGNLVIDPFCGSGVIFEAAKKLQLKAYGCDQDTTVAERRLALAKGE